MKTAAFLIQKEYTCDVLVVGGGISGLSAAVAAARAGADVMLCENGGALGGIATKGLVGPFMTCYDKKGEKQIIRGFFSEFVERMAAQGGAIPPENCHGGDSYSGYRPKGHIGVTPFSPEVFKRVAEEFCLEAGVKLLYHTQLIGAQTENNTIECAYFATVSGVEAVHAKVFIDTTGNASLAHHAGAETFYGDEAGMVQTVSTFFTITGVDKEALDKHMAENTDMRSRFYMDALDEGRRTGEFPCGTQKLRIFETLNGEWFVNMSQVDEQVCDLDVAQVTAAEISQRRDIPKIVAYLKKSVPALKNIRLVTTASDLGVRESRRIVGRTLLTGDDIMHSRHYDERIAVCANSIDIHQKDTVAYTPYESDNNYYIPLSCLISKNISNLMAAGKCMSADKYAFAAVRVMPPCFAMGEAAGITAAMALESGNDPSKVDVKKVQAAILANGGYLE